VFLLSTTEEKLRSDVVNVMKKLYQKNLITANGGGVATMIPNSEYILVTPSQVIKPDIKSEDLVKCDTNGNIVEGNQKPTSEKRTYINIFKNIQNINTIVHATNPTVMGLTEAGIKIKPMIAMHALYGLNQIPIIPARESYYKVKDDGDISETDMFDQIVIDKLKKSRVVILEKHGTYAIGESLNDAFYRLELLEEAAIIICVARLFSKENPEGWVLSQ